MNVPSDVAIGRRTKQFVSMWLESPWSVESGTNHHKIQSTTVLLVYMTESSLKLQRRCVSQIPSNGANLEMDVSRSPWKPWGIWMKKSFSSVNPTCTALLTGMRPKESKFHSKTFTHVMANEWMMIALIYQAWNALDECRSHWHHLYLLFLMRNLHNIASSLIWENRNPKAPLGSNIFGWDVPSLGIIWIHSFSRQEFHWLFLHEFVADTKALDVTIQLNPPPVIKQESSREQHFSSRTQLTGDFKKQRLELRNMQRVHQHQNFSKDALATTRWMLFIYIADSQHGASTLILYVASSAHN